MITSFDIAKTMFDNILKTAKEDGRYDKMLENFDEVSGYSGEWEYESFYMTYDVVKVFFNKEYLNDEYTNNLIIARQEDEFLDMTEFIDDIHEIFFGLVKMFHKSLRKAYHLNCEDVNC